MTDPVNDQSAARARDDLRRNVAAARRTLAQGEDRTEAIATIAVTLIEAEDAFSRNRLASLLALALVQIAEDHTR